MILDVDIGRSLSKWRLKDSNSNEIRSRGIVCASEEWQPGWNIPDLEAVKVIRISSADEADVLRNLIGRFSHQVVRIHVARSTQKALGVINGYEDPQQLEVSRWLEALAGYQLTGGCCVVDCGTVITIDFVLPSGCHLGGYVLPGFRLMKETLQLSTHNVAIDLDSEAKGLPVPGRETSAAVNHGIYIAAVSAVNRAYLEVCTKEGKMLPLLLTGNDAQILARGVQPDHTIWPDMVYGGLEACFPVTAAERAGQMTGAPDLFSMVELSAEAVSF